MESTWLNCKSETKEEYEDNEDQISEELQLLWYGNRRLYDEQKAHLNSERPPLDTFFGKRLENEAAEHDTVDLTEEDDSNLQPSSPLEPPPASVERSPPSPTFSGSSSSLSFSHQPIPDFRRTILQSLGLPRLPPTSPTPPSPPFTPLQGQCSFTLFFHLRKKFVTAANSKWT